MARLARIVVPGLPHHVTQRGNRRQPVFFGQEDYQAYRELIQHGCERYEVRVLAYCLMPAHVHLILVPSDEDGLARALGEAHRRYTRRINFREGWRGHLWQERFASFVMDDPYLLAATRYVERNPVKARLISRAEDWPWSSAAAHVDGRRKDPLAEKQWLRDLIADWSCSWREYLAERTDGEMARELSLHESTGRPLGEKSFVQHLGELLGRDLLPGKPGRPPKQRRAK
ncbi:MAG: transposase [Phycisphaerae bacterium]